MGLLDGMTATKKVWPCRVRQILAELEPSDRQILIDALADPAWLADPLTRALRDRGLIISSPTIRAHRQNVCSCSQVADA